MTAGNSTACPPTGAGRLSRPRLLPTAAAAGLGLLLLSSAATAQGPPAPMCTISVVGVAFGNYNPFTPTPTDSTGSVVYNCNSKAKNIRVTLGPGGSGTYFSRAMQSGPQSLGYNLFLDAARTIVWGDGTGGTSDYTDNNPPNNTNVVLTVYGRVPAAIDVGVGAYSDTVVASIEF